MKKYANIIISSTSKEIDRIFCYKIPENLDVEAGIRVIVPFGGSNKNYEGYVVGLSDSSDFDEAKIKSIISVLDDYPIFSKEMLELALYMKEKYFSTLSACLGLIIPSGIKMRQGLRKVKKKVRLKAGVDISQATKTQRRVLDYLTEHESAWAADLKNVLGVSETTLKNLLNKGFIEELEVIVRRKPYFAEEFGKTKPLELNSQQKNAFDFICSKINAGDTKPTLIKGVTGSGKTEVYLHLIDKVLSMGKDAVVLVPEISLTPQAVEIFVGRFGDKVSVTHSRLSAGERFDQWERARLGEISVMIGPRSAIFTPFANLGMIIIDEEHEHSYKSDSSPKYLAKEIAMFLCAQNNAHLVLGSATPSLESYYETETSQIDLIRLDERINKTMPSIIIEDMRKEMAEGNLSIFSRALAEALADAVAKKQQAILFLNRRGHSTFVSCRKCGYVMTCGDCNVNYTYHKFNNSLICHYCGKTAEVERNCPVCGSKYIKYFGVGTQKIEDEVIKLLPEAKVLRMDADTTSKKFSHEKILTAFRQKKADILIGTQMIAKGLDYPNVTLVGIICADTSLNLGDFRSGETAFQLLTQVAGRAGRADLSGRVFIQTYCPEHYSVVYSREHDYDGFYAHEIAVRRQMMYPPFTKIFSILFTGEEEKKIIILLFTLTDIMKHYDKNQLFETIGPAPAFISKIKNNYRWRLIVKSGDEDKLRIFSLFCLEKLKKVKDTAGVTMILTPNPVSIQ